MTAKTKLYFEIEDSGNYIRIKLNGLNYPNAELDWDRNWLNTLIEVKAGAFSGSFKADFMTTDFQRFKNELEILYNNLNGKADFKSLENQVEINIKGNGFGHLEAACRLMDKVGTGNELECELFFDQTQIPKMLKDLEKITSEFPVTGELKNSIG